MITYPGDASLEERRAISNLFRTISLYGAARIGETTAISTKVHIQDTSAPDEVTAILGSDAGAVFYGRSVQGEVLHLDVFHSPGEISPGLVAEGIASSIAHLTFEPVRPSSRSPRSLLPYTDVQTGLGGGRLDGALNLGKEPGARKAHLTHVHLTALFAPETLALAFRLVGALEKAILDAGFDLRKIRRVRAMKGAHPISMKGYEASTDSRLRPSATEEPPSRHLDEALAQTVAQEVGSMEDVRRLMKGLSRGMGIVEFRRHTAFCDGSSESIRDLLVSQGIMRFDGRLYLLTSRGSRLHQRFLEDALEIRAYLRRVLWLLPTRNPGDKSQRTPSKKESENRGRGEAIPWQRDQTSRSLALAETVVARGANLSFRTQDLRFFRQPAGKRRPIVLLMDASASMAGPRIHAAKQLARHLVLASGVNVLALAFQNTGAAVVFPFTKSLAAAEQGLGRISAMGLTPLAAGLEKALAVSLQSSDRPQVICLTDGIATVPLRSSSASADSVAVAKAYAARRIPFVCIGLEPDREFLKNLSAAAKGALHIVKELDAPLLTSIASRSM